MSCRFVASDQPRVVPGRHTGACNDEACPGCAPCPSSHCRVCSRVHAEGTCAECMAVTRETLHDIARMCDALPEEVEHRGIQGEAMMLLGPAADPEARGHLEASVLAGRVPADYLDHADGELHPLFVLATWQMVWVDALDHSEPEERVTIAEAVDYLDRQLTYMGGYEHVPFEDFARDLRRCSAHLEAVLHDGEQVELGAPCVTCGQKMQRTTESDGRVSYECTRCRRSVSEEQYRYAVSVAHMAHADRLPATELAQRIGVNASTVRRWVSVQRKTLEPSIVGGLSVPGETIELPPLLLSCGRASDGRKVYRVSVAEALRDELRGETA